MLLGGLEEVCPRYVGMAKSSPWVAHKRNAYADATLDWSHPQLNRACGVAHKRYAYARLEWLLPPPNYTLTYA